MTPKLVTFDCANTLIWTDWTAESFAVKCCQLAGLQLPLSAETEYLKLLGPKMPEFLELNQCGDLRDWREFWVQQISEWLMALNIEGADPLELHLIGEREIFESPSTTFKLFEDVVPCLESLKMGGIPLAVLSNWDLSLEPCLTGHGIRHYFDKVFASLVFGAEKPEPSFFRHALDSFGVQPSECIHIGDLIEDDYNGARSVGINAVLLDRSYVGVSKQSGTISSLSKFSEVFDWFD